jgi:hypothetical protein
MPKVLSRPIYRTALAFALRRVHRGAFIEGERSEPTEPMKTCGIIGLKGTLTMANVELLGVRVKVYADGRAAVLFYQRLGEQIVKRYLDDDGNWQEVKEGEMYPGISLVFHEFNDPFDHDMI